MSHYLLCSVPRCQLLLHHAGLAVQQPYCAQLVHPGMLCLRAIVRLRFDSQAKCALLVLLLLMARSGSQYQACRVRTAGCCHPVVLCAAISAGTHHHTLTAGSF